MMSLKEADPEQFYEHSFQLQDNKQKSAFNRDGIWTNLDAMYEIGKRCSSKETASRSSTVTDGLPQVTRNATAEVATRTTNRYKGNRKVKRLELDPFGKSRFEALVFKSYESTHQK